MSSLKKKGRGKAISLIVDTTREKTNFSAHISSREWQNTYLTQTEATQRLFTQFERVQALVRTRKGYAEQLRNLFAYERAIAGVITSFRSVPGFESSKTSRNFPVIFLRYYIISAIPISAGDFSKRVFVIKQRTVSVQNAAYGTEICPQYRKLGFSARPTLPPEGKDYLYEKGAGSKIHGEPGLSLPLWYARNAIRSTRKQRRPSTVDPEIGSANKLAVEIIFFSSLSPLFSSGVTVTGTTRSCLRSATRLPPRDPPFFAATLRIPVDRFFVEFSPWKSIKSAAWKLSSFSVFASELDRSTILRLALRVILIYSPKGIPIEGSNERANFENRPDGVISPMRTDMELKLRGGSKRCWEERKSKDSNGKIIYPVIGRIFY